MRRSQTIIFALTILFSIACHLMVASIPATPAPATQSASSPPTIEPHNETPVITTGAGPSIAGCPVFPENNFWNVRVDNLPVHPHSDDWVNAIGADSTFHANFGSGTWEGGKIGIPYNVVPAAQADVNLTFDEYGEESDPGPYPIPDSALMEAGSDHHILLVRQGECKLYELYHAHNEGGAWFAGSTAIWDLTSNVLRPRDWTSSDLAGMPILPGLARYEEVASGEIRHALRFTAFNTAEGYIWPARHPRPDLTAESQNLSLPPMGARFRLKAAFVIPADAPREVQTILQAMKIYGIVLTDHGSEWYVTGAPDERWNNEELHWFDENLRGFEFEALDTSGMMSDPDSAAAVP
jgi:hypothetical protein